jgi:acyl dehydratase
MTELEQTLASLKGTEISASDWVLVDQQRIDMFAAATEDRQWIHVDPERARRELPGGKTIAHGYLTLALSAGLAAKILELPGVASGVNYGLNKVRFMAPVPCGSRIRPHLALLEYERKAGAFLTTWQVTIEIEGARKPACLAEALALLQPAHQGHGGDGSGK